MFSILPFFNILSDSTATKGVPEQMAGSDIYIVMIVTLIVWGGVFFYLFYLDSKLKAIKKKVETFRRK